MASFRWRTDPVGFARDVFGIELWSKHVEIDPSLEELVERATSSPADSVD